MSRLIRISSIVVSFVAMLSVLHSSDIQNIEALQVLKAETAHSVRTWRRGITTEVTTSYKDFELNSCTLTFRTKTLPNDKSWLVMYPPQIFRYIFPLQSMEVRSEWLDAYNSYVLSLSGPGSLIADDLTPSIFFVSELKDNTFPAPNISIPFKNKDSATKVKLALQNAIAACGGKNYPIQKTDAPAGQKGEDLRTDAKDGKFEVKVNVDLVTTDVTVIGDNVPELRAEDLVVFDNGVAQPISYFSHDMPISVAIVLMDKEPDHGISQMNIAALSVLRLLKPGDQVALYSVDGDRLSNLTEDREYVAKLISFSANGQLYDMNIFGTLNDAARHLKQEASGRRAILLISYISSRLGNTFGHGGGRETFSKKQLKDLADRTRMELLESATTLYCFPPDFDWVIKSERFDEPFGIVKSVAEDTGGEVTVTAGSNKQSALPLNNLRKVINQLRTQYTLGFTPSNPAEHGTFHQLTVRLADKNRCPKCGIKARRGYYTGVSAPLPPARKPLAKPSRSPSEVDKIIIQESIDMAVLRHFDFDDISFTIKNSKKIITPNRQSQMMIDLSINPAQIDMIPAEGQRTYRIQAAIFYMDKWGKILGSNLSKVDGSLNEEDYKRVMQNGIPFSAMIPLIANDQVFKIVLYDEISGRMTSKFVKKKGDGLTITTEHNEQAYRTIPTEVFRKLTGSGDSNMRVQPQK
jgi:Ca-activated chloride channel homolog